MFSLSRCSKKPNCRRRCSSDAHLGGDMCFTKSQALQGIRMVEGCLPGHVLNMDDILMEILVRVPPEFILEPIRVSKRWFQLICSSSFRKYYIRRWRLVFPLTGLKGFYTRKICFVQTPLRGEMFIRYKREEEEPSCVFEHRDCFVDCSSNGIILIGRNGNPFTFIVWNPFAKVHHQLPPPPMNYPCGCTAFTTEYYGNGSFDYKVFRASTPDDAGLLLTGCIPFPLPTDSISLQTFSSKTGVWEQTTLTCSPDLQLGPFEVGIVIGDVIHWITALGKGVAVYDPKNGNRRLASVGSPDTDSGPCAGLGESFDGLLQYAQRCFSFSKIWVLLPNYKWVLRYKIDHQTLWDNNSALIPQPTSPWDQLEFLSFLPRNSKYVFFKYGRYIFLLHLASQKLQHVCETSLSYRGKSVPYYVSQ